MRHLKHFGLRISDFGKERSFFFSVLLCAALSGCGASLSGEAHSTPRMVARIWEPRTETGRAFKATHLHDYETVWKELSAIPAVDSIEVNLRYGLGANTRKLFFGAAVFTSKPFSVLTSSFDDRAASVLNALGRTIFQALGNRKEMLSDTIVAGAYAEFGWYVRDLKNFSNPDRVEFVDIYVDREMLTTYLAHKITLQQVIDSAGAYGHRVDKTFGPVRVMVGEN